MFTGWSCAVGSDELESVRCTAGLLQLKPNGMASIFISNAILVEVTSRAVDRKRHSADVPHQLVAFLSLLSHRRSSCAAA
jgi:hypothetical protein